MTDISVVVSTYSEDRSSDLASCISSLKHQTYNAAEIILALDPKEKLIDFYNAFFPEDIKKVVAKANGLSYARNAGVKRARGEIVAFIDDDATADKKWLENLAKNYKDPSVVGVGGLIKPRWETCRPWWFPEELDWVVGCSYRGLPKKRAVVRNPIGCNMSFRKKAIVEAGFFSTNLGRLGKSLVSNEDTELSLRINVTKPWCKILYDPSAVVYHKVPKSRTTLRYVATRSYHEGISKALFSSDQLYRETKVLDVESSYLRSILLSLPIKAYGGRCDGLAQASTLLISTFLVLIGYLVGKTQDLF